MKRKRTLTLALALVLLLSCTGFAPVHAAQAETEVPQTTEQPQNLPNTDTDDSTDDKHTERLVNEEQLNTHIYRNSDGTKTMYIYDHPVKYRDEQGQTHDISLDIVDTGDTAYPFRTQANSAVTAFPASLPDGITLTGNGVNLRLAAQLPAGNIALNHNARRVDTQTIAYTYDAKTTIEYGLTYSGFKEDIVVSEYTGQTEYPFILYTDGLNLTNIDGGYYLTDNDGTIQASIGEIIVFTADERNNTFGTLQVTTIKPGQIYGLTIVLDADYLADPQTVYPIRIDPTVELVYTDDTPNAIEEKTLQSNNTTSGSNTATVIGLNAKGISRTIMKFPGMNFSALNGVVVESAAVTIRDLMCQSEEMTVTCYPFTGGAWTENDAQWANLTQSWGAALDSNVISYASGVQQETAHRYRFDITQLAQEWVNGTADEDLGIIFRSPDAVENGTEYFYKTFATSERASYKPTFEITYRDTFSLNYDSVDVSKGGSVNLIVTSILEIAGEITWESSAPDVATVSGSGVVTALNAGETIITASGVDVDGNPRSDTCTIYVKIPDGVYYIKNSASGLCLYNKINGNAYLHSQNTDASDMLYQLWEISYVSAGNYVIRPLRDLSVALTVGNNGYVTVADAAVNNMSVAAGFQWKIIHNSFGYAFMLGGEQSKTITPIAGSLVHSDSWTAYPTSHWELESADGVFLRDTDTLQVITASTERYAELGQPYTLADLGLSLEYYGNRMAYSWTSSNTTISTVDNNGKSTAINRGETVIKITMTIDAKTYTSQFSLSVIETIYVVNLYDSTIAGDNAILSNIGPAINFLNTVYADQFNLRFVADGEPTRYTNGVDQCPHGANATCSYSTCGDSCLQHHKNVVRIIDELYDTYRDSNHVTVMWSNSPRYTFCKGTTNHEVIDDFGLHMSGDFNDDGVYIPIPVILILTINNFTVDASYGTCADSEYMAIVLAHEIAHSLGLKEVYNNVYGDGIEHAGTEGMQCIMETLHFGTMDYLYDLGSAALCENCRGKLHDEIPDNAYELLFDTIVADSTNEGEYVCYEIHEITE